MNVYIVMQQDPREDIIVGVFHHMDAAMECKQAGAEVGFNRSINVCGVVNYYNAKDDWFVIEEQEETV
jgi:hypothetical protein